MKLRNFFTSLIDLIQILWMANGYPKRILSILTITFSPVIVTVAVLLLFFLIVIRYRDWLKRKPERLKDRLKAYPLYVLAVLFWLCDVALNYTVFAVLFGSFGWQSRTNMRFFAYRTISDRLRYYKANTGLLRNHLLALWFCGHLVEKVDKGHCG